MEGREIKFTEKARGPLCLLEIVTPGRRSTLSFIRSLLFDHKVQIAQVESHVHEQGLVERFYLLEDDGTQIRRKRAAALRTAVKKAVRLRQSAEAAA
jgi:hypothetical protein